MILLMVRRDQEFIILSMILISLYVQMEIAVERSFTEDTQLLTAQVGEGTYNVATVTVSLSGKLILWVALFRPSHHPVLIAYSMQK